MSLPQNKLSPHKLFSPFAEPRFALRNPLFDYETGGVDLTNPKLGLQYQSWVCRVIGKKILLFSSRNQKVYEIYEGQSITEVSLSFDSNMNYALAYVENKKAYFKWFNPLVNSYVNLDLGDDIINPRCTLDDKREFNGHGRDILLAYLKTDGKLYFRQQRERYAVERILHEGFYNVLYNFGLNTQMRLQFLVDFIEEE